MSSPTPKSTQQPVKSSGSKAVSVNDKSEDVSPLWLLKALGATLVAALICGYLTACLLFYQGQWQLVLHPSRSTPAPATVAGIAVETIHFGVDESAIPQLTGWYVPASPGAAGNARFSAYTVLYLPSGDGSLTDSIFTLAAIHSLGLNLFAFDYRGYGQSASTHPNQQRMSQDVISGWQYLTVSRGVPPGKIVLWGSGVGAALAAKFAVRHPEMPAAIFDFPRTDVLETVLADQRTEFLPVRVLFHDRFDIAAAVAHLRTPKLFLLPGVASAPAGSSSTQTSSLVAEASAPKMTAYLKPPDRTAPVFSDQLFRFLDEYLP